MGILVSGLLNPHGNPPTIIRMIIARKVRIILDSRDFHEYDVVLKRPRFGFSPNDVNSLLSFFKLDGLWIVPPPVLKNLPDPSNRSFYELAYHSRVPLITGNTKHFPDDIMVMTPTEFVKRKESQIQ